MRPLPVSLCLTALCLGIARLASPQATSTVDSAVSITMRDGVVLRADVLRPSGPGRFPVLVYRTPYDRADAADATGLAKKAVQRGYAVVVQDVRGRYGSDGTFTAYSQEGKDGYDTIEWAAQQPWSNGAVGSFGLSYPGAVQWLAAMEHPPSLKAMVPAMTYATPETFWYSGGVWDGSWLDWTWFNIAPDLRRRLGVSGAQTSEEAAKQWETDRDRLRNYRPLSTLPDFEGVAPWYYEWMRHPPRDSWWKWATLEGKYSAVSAAVLNISGWFDEPYGPFGAVTNYQGLVTSRAADDPRTKLILGAWTHGVAAVQREKAGDRLFGSDAAIDYDETVLRWMDRYLKNVENGLDSDPPVKAFLMGANTWRTSQGWPFEGTRTDTLFLAASVDSKSNGRLEHHQSRSAGSSTVRSDPAHPLADPYEGKAGVHDYAALTGRPDIAVFETEPFKSAVDVIGPVVAELSVGSKLPDFDVWVQVYDVAPEGQVWNLTTAGSGLQRASYRDGGPDRKPLQPGQIVSLRLDRLFTANRFLPGHRLRIIVSTAFTPWFSVNPQTGEIELFSNGARAGDVVIQHSKEHPSRLLLPVVP